VKICAEKPNSMFTSKDLQTRFNVSVKTIRSDLEGLVSAGLMEPVSLNKRLTGYTRSKNFELRLEEIRGN
jgi:DeoR/GlpR family transcriptional regulator of sugar metabolism